MTEESKSLETGNNQQELKRRPIKSFVIRSGRMTLGQQKGWQECWPKLGLELGQAGTDIRTEFTKQQPLIVEIGFGMGGSLSEMAAAAADLNFLGIEVHRPGVGALMALAQEQNLENIKVFCADANEVLKEHISDNSIHRLQLYFPDPWHKVRHNKRRLVQPAFVQTIRPKLEIGGIFHMATDWEPYAHHMMEVMESAEGFRNVSGENQYAEHPEYRPYTKFEKRGQNLGHGVWDLLFERVS
jgi:tRNA (guanine-N7-)-methyltransferase